jgi:hypothetical protein
MFSTLAAALLTQDGFLKDLAEVWQEHGRDTMLHTAKTQPATFFEAPNECAIYLLRSSLRQTSCWFTAFLLARTTTRRAETTIAATITLRDGWYRLSGFSAPHNEPCVFASYHMVAHPFTRRP